MSSHRPCDRRTSEVETGIEPVCTALQAVASPLGHSTMGRDPRADDGIRTRDPHLGKVMRYQLRYIRMLREQILWTICCSRCDAEHYPTDTLLPNRLVRASQSRMCAAGGSRDRAETHPETAIWVPSVDPCSLSPRAPTPLRVARGPVAQWKSVPFTPGRSLVRSQPGPHESGH